MKDGLSILLAKYKLTQQSAEHHNYMSWLVSTLFLLSSIYLIVGLLDNLDKSPLLIIFASLIGIFLVVGDIIIFKRAQDIKKAKYKLFNKYEEKFKEDFKYKYFFNHKIPSTEVPFWIGFTIKLFIGIFFIVLLSSTILKTL